jgi:cell division septation protein DedD
MANKSLWIVLVLVAAGIGIFFFSFKQNEEPSPKVTMQPIFSQTPASPNAPAPEKDPVPSPAIVTSPEHGQEAGFAVQVYSFKDEKRADAALANLKSKGYKAYIEISDLGAKGTWYRVRIGSLANEAEAKALLETVRKNFNSGIIVKPKA